MTDENWIDSAGPINVQAGNLQFTYARHHVIATEVFDGSPFLKALQAKGSARSRGFYAGGKQAASRQRHAARQRRQHIAVLA
jgi:hypothetical protein